MSSLATLLFITTHLNFPKIGNPFLPRQKMLGAILWEEKGKYMRKAKGKYKDTK
jgi:hypothetical protein